MKRQWLSRLKTGVVSLICILCGSIALAETSAEQVKSAEAAVNPNSVTVSADSKTIEIRLVSNKTTGYSWFLEHYNASLLKPISYRYIVPSVSMVGAPGVSVWTFQVLPHALPIHDRITWVSIRPSEKLTSPTFFSTDIYFLSQ